VAKLFLRGAWDKRYLALFGQTHSRSIQVHGTALLVVVAQMGKARMIGVGVKSPSGGRVTAARAMFHCRICLQRDKWSLSVDVGDETFQGD